MKHTTTTQSLPDTYAANQWLALARDGYIYDRGFMIRGSVSIIVPQGERRAARAACACVARTKPPTSLPSPASDADRASPT